MYRGHRVVIPGLLTIFFLSALGFAVIAGCGGSQSGIDVEQHKRLAGDLRDNKLYEAAIEEYRKVLDSPGLDDTQRGNISYLIARIYFEDLKDYRNAAAYYVRARSYSPDASYSTEASRNLVASLEKLGQFVDAKRELGAAVDIDSTPKTRGVTPVAIIDKDTIWLSEVEARIQSMPAQMQQQYLTPEAKRDFVRNYVGAELLYRAALREGYDRDPEMARQKEQLYKNLLVDRFLVNKVMPEVTVDTADVRNYYLANKNARYNDMPYDSVKAKVFMDYQSEKAEAGLNDYLAKLYKAEKVTFLDHNIRD